MPDAPLLLLHPHARSAWIISQLAPDRPWRASNLRVRCTLILSVTIADLLYSFMQLVAASIDIANAEAAAAPFCWVMGPLMYFSIFSLYISIANIAHYSFHRLTRRTGDRRAVVWAVSRYGGSFEMTYGYCIASQSDLSARLVVVSLQAMCYLFTLGVAIFMAVRARSQHSPAVVKRQQGVVVGYIAVTIIVGTVQMLKFIWAHTADSVPNLLIDIYMTLNLLWPIANFIVFVVVTRTEAGWDTRASITSTGQTSIKDVGFAVVDSRGLKPKEIDKKDGKRWRARSHHQIKRRGLETGEALRALLEQIIPLPLAGETAEAVEERRKERANLIRAVLQEVLEGGTRRAEKLMAQHHRGRGRLLKLVRRVGRMQRRMLLLRQGLLDVEDEETEEAELVGIEEWLLSDGEEETASESDVSEGCYEEYLDGHEDSSSSAGGNSQTASMLGDSSTPEPSPEKHRRSADETTAVNWRSMLAVFSSDSDTDDYRSLGATEYSDF